MGKFGADLKRYLIIRNEHVRNCLSECLASFILVSFCIGSGAMITLPPKLTTFMCAAIAAGFGLTMAIWAGGGVSGGHANPAVTLGFASVGQLPFRHVPVYWLGQYIGAFVAPACVYGVYIDALNNFDGGVRQVTGPNATASIFATYPQEYVSTAEAFFDQFFSSMLLMLCILAILDRSNIGAPHGVEPLAIGLIVLLIGISFGSNCSFPLNPSRDLMPRIFTTVAGWGVECFTLYAYYVWIPVVGPHVGMVVGAWLYELMIGIHIPREHDQCADTLSFDSCNKDADSPQLVEMNTNVG
jgi:MIP family channel proteins